MPCRLVSGFDFVAVASAIRSPKVRMPSTLSTYNGPAFSFSGFDSQDYQIRVYILALFILAPH